MQNYIKWVREFLENDIDVQVYTNNIHFLRVPKTKQWRPLIVFSEVWQKNPYQWNFWEKWWDVFPVLFECCVDYIDTIKGREMRELLKKKFNWFRWKLTNDFIWNITHIEDVDIWYDEVNDIVRWWSVYLFKSTK